MRLIRRVCGYNKENEKLEVEVELEVFPKSQVTILFGLPEEDPLYESFSLSPELEDILRSANNIPPLNRKEFDYFLECYETS